MIEPAIFQVLFGIYFLQMAWSHYWGIILIGLGRERLVAGVHSVEGVLILILGTALTARSGPTGMILGAVCALACASNWMLPLFAWRSFAQPRSGSKMSSSKGQTDAIRVVEGEWV
jgi:membrane-bound ClpP family serine protease